MDPSDRVFRRISISGPDNILADGQFPVLAIGEEMVSPTLELSGDAVDHGLTIIETGAYAPQVGPNYIKFWLEIEEASRTDPAFDGGGVELSAELTFTTNMSPPPRYQRTITQRVAHQ